MADRLISIGDYFELGYSTDVRLNWPHYRRTTGADDALDAVDVVDYYRFDVVAAAAVVVVAVNYYRRLRHSVRAIRPVIRAYRSNDSVLRWRPNSPSLANVDLRPTMDWTAVTLDWFDDSAIAAVDYVELVDAVDLYLEVVHCVDCVARPNTRPNGCWVTGRRSYRIRMAKAAEEWPHYSHRRRQNCWPSLHWRNSDVDRSRAPDCLTDVGRLADCVAVERAPVAERPDADFVDAVDEETDDERMDDVIDVDAYLDDVHYLSSYSYLVVVII